MTTPDRSTLFTNFNAARSMARRGDLDMGRLNKALGLAQSKEERPYHATAHGCQCKDRAYRGVICKHMLAVALAEA